jgi:hypothetical protein
MACVESLAWHGEPVRELLGVRRLVEAVGTTYRRDGVIYVPLPHPPGASTR